MGYKTTTVDPIELEFERAWKGISEGWQGVWRKEKLYNYNIVSKIKAIIKKTAKRKIGKININLRLGGLCSCMKYAKRDLETLP